MGRMRVVSVRRNDDVTANPNLAGLLRFWMDGRTDGRKDGFALGPYVEPLKLMKIKMLFVRELLHALTG